MKTITSKNRLALMLATAWGFGAAPKVFKGCAEAADMRRRPILVGGLLVGTPADQEAVWAALDGKVRDMLRQELDALVPPAARDAAAAMRAEELETETISPGEYILATRLTNPRAFVLACALAPNGNWVHCTGEAHQAGVDKDHCGVCLGSGWGKLYVAPGYTTAPAVRAGASARLGEIEL